MATGGFKCSTCSRTFSMAAHLGRHMSTLHATKLEAQRSRLLARLAQLESQIRTITGAVESLENLR